MYYGHINHIQANRFPAVIQFALNYLKTTDFEVMETGVYELKGREVYVQVLDLDTKPAEAFQPEVHRNYIDVQYLHRGKEIMQFAVDNGTNPIAVEYNPERDILFYQAVANEQSISLEAGNFAIFFPEDAHRTAIAHGTPTIRKVVVKIAVSQLDQFEAGL